MKINIKKSDNLITPALEEYIEEKLMPLAKFVKHFDETGEAEMWMEVSRTTDHHQKGDVFKVAVDLRLPHKILRAEENADDVHKAIDAARNTLQLEIEKYKAKFEDVRHQRREGKE
ncbi:MAG TPA: ribosome-associated translation inhibitor RaiA [Candidatus Paceibacterota bacterium]|jgi:ribosomal subunit interface protein|nr:ribosome-associated translation inhibitor RaiA [Candidatus Paceibacterota bacterium]